MLKKILGILVVLGILAYLVFAILQFSGSTGIQRCTKVDIQIMDSTERAYVTSSEILNLLYINDLKPVGQRLDKINYRRIEKVVSVLKMVSRVECFSTNSKSIVVRVWQQTPILRIHDENESHYIGIDGKRLGLSYNTAADVLVASGSNMDSIQMVRLYNFAMMLRKDAFWDAQVEQVFVEPNGEWTLIPRIGKYEILLGLPISLEDKLTRLKLFYNKALPKVGWERYSKISLKYKNQIVCTLKEK